MKRVVLALAAACLTAAAPASDHLDSPKVIADPRVDIGDIYAWTSSDGHRLNLVMTIVGHAFDKNAEYAFHIDSGPRFPDTTARTDIVCRFASMTQADCLIGRDETIQGDPSAPAGLKSASGRSLLFAGLRDDPFFNNVKGSRDAFDLAAATLKQGVPRDAAGCPAYTPRQTAAILDRWRHTDGGPPRNFLAGWTPASIVRKQSMEWKKYNPKEWPELQVPNEFQHLMPRESQKPLGPNSKWQSLRERRSSEWQMRKKC